VKNVGQETNSINQTVIMNEPIFESPGLIGRCQPAARPDRQHCQVQLQLRNNDLRTDYSMLIHVQALKSIVVKIKDKKEQVTPLRILACIVVRYKQRFKKYNYSY